MMEYVQVTLSILISKYSFEFTHLACLKSNESQFFVFSFLVSKIDCEWGEWQIGDCSKTCGKGSRTRTRTKIVEEANGGKCEGGSTMQEPCDEQDCPGNFTLLTYIL